MWPPSEHAINVALIAVVLYSAWRRFIWYTKDED